MILSDNRSGKYEYIFSLLIFSLVMIFSSDLENRAIFSWFPAMFFSILYLFFMISKRKLDKGFLLLISVNALWVAYSSLNIFNVLSPDLHIKAALEMLIWLTYFYLLYNRVDKFNNSINFFLLSAVSIFIIVSFPQFLYFITTNEGSKSFSGFFNNRNDFAVLATFFLAVQVYLGEKKSRISLIKQVSLCFLVFVTLSTKGVVSIVIIYLVYFRTNFGFVSRLIITVLFSLTLFFLVVSNDQMYQRISGKFESLTIETSKVDESSVGRDSGKIRVLLYISSLNLINDYPIFGVGINNAQFYMPIPERSNLQALNTQNNFSEMALNAGVPGFIIYYAPFIYMLVFFFRRKGNLANLCLSVLLMKMFNDTGMKSYNEAVQLVSVVFVFYVYLNRHRLI